LALFGVAAPDRAFERAAPPSALGIKYAPRRWKSIALNRLGEAQIRHPAIKDAIQRASFPQRRPEADAPDRRRAEAASFAGARGSCRFLRIFGGRAMGDPAVDREAVLSFPSARGSAG